MAHDVFSYDESTYVFILNIMTPFIMEKGMAIVKNDENLKDPLLFTKKLLDLRMEINLMVEGSFDNKMIF